MGSPCKRRTVWLASRGPSSTKCIRTFETSTSPGYKERARGCGHRLVTGPWEWVSKYFGANGKSESDANAASGVRSILAMGCTGSRGGANSGRAAICTAIAVSSKTKIASQIFKRASNESPPGSKGLLKPPNPWRWRWGAACSMPHMSGIDDACGISAHHMFLSNCVVQVMRVWSLPAALSPLATRKRSISRRKHDLHRRNAQSARFPANPVCGSRAQRLPGRAHVPMIWRAGHARLGARRLSVSGGRCPEMWGVARVRTMPSEQEESARNSSLWQ